MYMPMGRGLKHDLQKARSRENAIEKVFNLFRISKDNEPGHCHSPPTIFDSNTLTRPVGASFIYHSYAVCGARSYGVS